ncbi:ABC transporter ATP-binding protein [Miniphocaeibacter halophilus]|uniref:ABC transporter ATP-binding protein n=2 Tax=Miniphocaeibacter halophilus TaxID=2931922 RepID=A0AC61N298_9FIRM|nr:ABC transporter ATP-binding protein [Miniphocaeibacter halophilus]
MKNITKTFGQVVANEDITFKVFKNEVHCLLGENGTGKTTLMNILFGLYHPDSGEILINGEKSEIQNPKDAFHKGVGMVHQHFMLIERMTVLENIILGKERGSFFIDYEDSRRIIIDLIEKYNFQIDVDEKVENLSVGTKQRVEIIKTLYRGADIIILDEPTAVLTPQEVEELFKILYLLKSDGKTIIFITHKLNETMEIADRVTILRKGKNIATVETKEVNPMILAEYMVGRTIESVMNNEDIEFGKEVLSIENLQLLKGKEGKVSFSIREGEIFGIAGVEGNGQLELEEFIVGLREANPDAKIEFLSKNISKFDVKNRKNMGIGYIPSDRHKRGMVEDFSLTENYLLGYQDNDKFVKKLFIKMDKLIEHSEKMINLFRIKALSSKDKIGQLSGGNQQKTILSREVGMNPSLIIAAQPVRGLDIGAIEFVHKTLMDLKREGKAILLISAELSEVMNLSDTIAVLYEGKFKAKIANGVLSRENIGLLMAGEDLEKVRGENSDGK